MYGGICEGVQESDVRMASGEAPEGWELAAVPLCTGQVGCRCPAELECGHWLGYDTRCEALRWPVGVILALRGVMYGRRVQDESDY